MTTWIWTCLARLRCLVLGHEDLRDFLRHGRSVRTLRVRCWHCGRVSQGIDISPRARWISRP